MPNFFKNLTKSKEVKQKEAKAKADQQAAEEEADRIEREQAAQEHCDRQRERWFREHPEKAGEKALSKPKKTQAKAGMDESSGYDHISVPGLRSGNTGNPY